MLTYWLGRTAYKAASPRRDRAVAEAIQTIGK